MLKNIVATKNLAASSAEKRMHIERQRGIGNLAKVQRKKSLSEAMLKLSIFRHTCYHQTVDHEFLTSVKDLSE